MGSGAFQWIWPQILIKKRLIKLAIIKYNFILLFNFSYKNFKFLSIYFSSFEIFFQPPIVLLELTNKIDEAV